MQLPSPIRSTLWNDAEGRPRTPWRILLAVVVLVLGILVGTSVVGVVAAVAGLGVAFFETGAGILLGTAGVAAGVTGALWLVARYVDRRRFVDYGLRIDDRISRPDLHVRTDPR